MADAVERYSLSTPSIEAAPEGGWQPEGRPQRLRGKVVLPKVKEKVCGPNDSQVWDSLQSPFWVTRSLLALNVVGRETYLWLLQSQAPASQIHPRSHISKYFPGGQWGSRICPGG